MPKIYLETVKNIEIADASEDSTPCLTYTFLDRYPTKEDADINGYIYVYKPKDWPELIQPQYRNAPCHILAKEGYWTRLNWKTLQQYSYTSKHWKQRLYYTHWKPLNLDCDGYLFDPIEDYNLLVPDGLDWDTYDWSGVVVLVDKANALMDQGMHADLNEIKEIHKQLKEWLDFDDCFYLNQWLNFCRKVKQFNHEFNW